ncbi:hypothetical protein ACFYP4_15570 [Streptomyces sp. NPDC005551]|uniref:hypothetical protein n=1 Tax=Streptomyces sp. NPDC005551 TaxID=3364725 RepID=UPI003675BB37
MSTHELRDLSASSSPSGAAGTISVALVGGLSGQDLGTVPVPGLLPQLGIDHRASVLP